MSKKKLSINKNSSLSTANKTRKLKELIDSLYNKELNIRQRLFEVQVANEVFNKLRFPKKFTVDDFVCSIAGENRNFWFLLGDMTLEDFAYKLFIKQLSTSEREMIDFFLFKRDRLTKRARKELRGHINLVLSTPRGTMLEGRAQTKTSTLTDRKSDS